MKYTDPQIEINEKFKKLEDQKYSKGYKNEYDCEEEDLLSYMEYIEDQTNN